MQLAAHSSRFVQDVLPKHKRAWEQQHSARHVPHRSVWTKSADDILTSITRFATRTLAVTDGTV